MKEKKQWVNGKKQRSIWRLHMKIVNTATWVTLSNYWNPTSFNVRAHCAKWMWVWASGCESIAMCKSMQESVTWNVNIMHVNTGEWTLQVLNWSSACKWKQMWMQECVMCLVGREPMLNVCKPISEHQLHACVKTGEWVLWMLGMLGWTLACDCKRL